MRNKRTRSTEYRIWEAMKYRCTNPSCKAFKDYGGRGITVCQKWMKFDGFFDDMGLRPTGKTLDRIDNNAGYSKENCRWASMREQSRNRRSNKFITAFGITLLVSDWADGLGIQRSRFSVQMKKRVNIEEWLKVYTGYYEYQKERQCP